MFLVTSACAALQTTSENFLLASRAWVIDLKGTKSSNHCKAGFEKSLIINFTMLMSSISVVSMASLCMALNLEHHCEK